MNTVPRFEPANDRVLLLAATAQAFKVAATTIATPARIDFTAGLINMQGQVAFAASNASVLTRVGNVASMTYGGMVGDSVTVTASIVVDGLTYTASQTVSKIFDGVTGNSARICYSKTNLMSLGSAPATLSTEGATSYPPIDTWGVGTVWEGSPPLFVAGESLYRSDGIFNPASGTTKWAAPYLNALKVWQLSAISADLGKVTAGDIYSATLHGGAGYPTNAFDWPSAAGSGGGFHLSSQGLLLGNYKAGQYFIAYANGRIEAPGLAIQDGNATFSGALMGASGSFKGTLTGRNVVAANLEANMALIGTVIRSQTYNPGSYGWMINADGTAEFSVLSITGRPTGPVYGYSWMEATSVTLATLGSATGIAAAHKVILRAEGDMSSAAAAGSIITITLYRGTAAGAETTFMYTWTVRASTTGGGVWTDEVLYFSETFEVAVATDAGRTGSGAFFKAIATRAGSSTSGTNASITLSTNIKNPTV
ncbi:hypothetical protein [Janthinobacterium sp. RB2P8]|uniref:hypothetical protein n=1 Tax=Janthinobacterium sp. RB2P8 TaxID=3424191 RepID=UPI003F294DAB